MAVFKEPDKGFLQTQKAAFSQVGGDHDLNGRWEPYP